MARKMSLMKYFGRRRVVLLYLPLLVVTLSALVVSWCLAQAASRALTPPAPPDQNLSHFRRNRHLKDYLDEIQVLIEPSASPCEALDKVPVLVVVVSSPRHYEQRAAIRSTWARHLPTLFFLGLQGPMDEQLVDNYMESKEHADMVVLDLQEHYQNLTLKSALMLRWALERCPQARAVFKTDDDVLVNPWTLTRVLREHQHAELLGYKINNTAVHRTEYVKWYMPRWLYPEDTIPEYLSGTGYMIAADYVRRIVRAATEVPLINLEDVYFTYLVARRSLGLSLSHDSRLSPYRPWLPLSCALWSLASSHSWSPGDIVAAWPKIRALGNRHDRGEDVCSVYGRYIYAEVFLY